MPTITKKLLSDTLTPITSVVMSGTNPVTLAEARPTDARCCEMRYRRTACRFWEKVGCRNGTSNNMREQNFGQRLLL